MNYSAHYNLNLVEGTDLVNPLTVDVPNYTAIDNTMFANEQAGVGTATELKSGSIHAITRANQNRDVFKFHSTSIYNAGDTFTVDGATVTALAVDGGSLKDRCFIVGSDVLCILNGSQLTVLATYVPDTINASSVYPMESSPSTHNYAAGDHLIVDGVTYYALTSISIGDSLIIDTNIKAQTLGTRMNNIEQNIIIESSNNTNGRYVKFADGTMICWKQVSYNGAVNDPSGALYASDNIDLGSFPVSFYDEPNIQVSSSALGIMSGSRNASASAAGIVNLYRTSSVASIFFIVKVFAIGRWKA